jgi:ABC-2 type transport system permease protein
MTLGEKMAGFAAALWAEGLKARRSKVLWLSALGIALAPLMGGLFMLIFKDPEWARTAGLLSTKAQLAMAPAEWPTYFGLLTQATAIGGFLVFAVVLIWLFGREYGDGTAKDLLALPTARTAIVLAKFGVSAIWSLGLAAIIYGLGLAIGGAIQLPGGSPALMWQAAGQMAVTATLTILLVTPLALAASAGRGYLPPVGVMFLATFFAQVLAALGWGPYFPWSVPALYSGAAGPAGYALGPVSFALVALTGGAGIAATLAWWRWADQT